MAYARPHNCFRAGSRPQALDLSILTLPCFQQLAQEQARPSNTTAAAFLRHVLTGDPNLLLNTGLWLLLLLYSPFLLGCEILSGFLFVFGLLPGEKKKTIENKQLKASMPVLGFTCWTPTFAGLNSASSQCGSPAALI